MENSLKSRIVKEAINCGLSHSQNNYPNGESVDNYSGVVAVNVDDKVFLVKGIPSRSIGGDPMAYYNGKVSIQEKWIGFKL
tara:strand:+ start:110 stop:352 length:243 start_codon:yes stop_codon:yes gene_type:complete